MTPMDWAGIAASITATLAGIGAFSRWMIKSYLSELKPNGGSSLNDKIKLEVLPLLTEIKVDLAELRGRLDTHIEANKE
jgi:hypothetical protein